MNCSQAREYLFAFLDGELDAPLSIELQRHLDHCPTCAREAEIERTIRRQLVAVVNAQHVTELQPLLKRAMARVHASARRPRRWWRAGLETGRSRSMAAAAVLLLMLGGWLVLRASWPSPAPLQLAEVLATDFEHFLSAGKPLDIQSSDSQVVSAWLSDRTRITAALPRMEHGRCKLVGGRPCKVAGRPAAFALYEIDGRPASLIAVEGTDADLRGMVQVAGAPHAYWVDRCRGYTVVASVADGVVRAAIGKAPEGDLRSLLGTAHDG